MPTFNGDGSANIIDGSASDDVINGGGGNDRLYGGAGSDVLVGGDGDDALWAYGQSGAAADGVALTATRIATGLERPVFATFAPSSQNTFYSGPALDTNRLFIVEAHTGQIEIFDLTTNTRLATPFLDIPDAELSRNGEEGVLGLAFHPDYASNGKFYVYLTNAAGNIELRQYSASADPNLANAAGDIILTIPHPTFANHNGGWIGFGPDGMLYLAVGDGGSGGDPFNNAQNRDVLLGKMLRIDVNSDAFPGDPNRDYAIPVDNPFAGATAGADEIWAFGLRNPWRNSFDPATGDLYIADVGQDAREEINVGPAGVAGRNYGWRVMEGDTVFSASTLPGPTDPSLVAPIRVYNRDAVTGGFSITGGYVYRGPATAFDGAYFYADFVTSNLWTLVYENGAATPSIVRSDDITTTAGVMNQIASFAVDAAGRLFVVGLDGELFRLDLPADRTDAPASLFGGAGNDRLYGGTGADLLNGGDGRDLMDGGAGDDVYEVTDTQDTIVELPNAGIDGVRVTTSWFMLPSNVENVFNFVPGTGAFTAYGNASANFMRGGAGQDTFYGGAGNDRLEGFDGADTLFGEGGDDYIWGGAGNDIINGGAGVNVLEGAGGDDVYDISTSTTFVIEEAAGGLDIVRTDNLSALGLGANLEYLFNFGAQTFSGFGNELANFIRGGEGADTLLGNAGDDRLEGWGGADTLFGGDGADFVWGGAGNDQLSAGAGNDVVEGFDGSDAVNGAAGDDVIRGGRGLDGLYGETGDDTFLFDISDLEANVRDYAWDYANAAGNNDRFRFTGVQQNAVTLAQEGGDVIISIALAGGGTASVFVFNTTVGAVQADLIFG